MEFFSVMLIIWAVKVLAEDGFAQVKGETNPRIERRRARQRSRANNPIWTQFVGWLGDVAEDGRQEQGRRRQVKRERQQRQREQAAAKPEVIEPSAQPDRVPVPDATAEPFGTPFGSPFDDPDDDYVDDPQTPDPEETDSPPDPEPEPEPIPAEPTDDERPLATVIPMFPTKEDLNMSTPSGEAPGLVHAIGFAEAMKTTYKNFSATGDTFEASLAQGEVSGEAAAAAARAREFERMAAEAWGQCATALKKQLSGKEFYNANPGAGKREFLVND